MSPKPYLCILFSGVFYFSLAYAALAHAEVPEPEANTEPDLALMVDLAGAYVPNHLELDQTGFLARLHQWLLAETQLTGSLQVMLGSRALTLFEAGKVDGIYPSWVPAKYKVNVLYSSPFMKINHFIYTKHGEKPLTRLAQLSNKRVGLIQSYQLNLDISAYENLYVSYAINSQALVNLLLSGRVDAIILSDIEVDALEVSMDISPLSVDSSVVVTSKYLGYAFLNNAKGVQLQKRFNAAILKAQRAGIVDVMLNSAN